MEHVINFGDDGTAQTLWTDLIPLAELGHLRVQRASWIDWNEHTQKWEVRLSPHADDPVFSHESREVCLQWEHQLLNQ